MTLRDLQLQKALGSFMLAKLLILIVQTAILVVKWSTYTILVCCHKFWSSKRRNQLQMMDSYKMGHSFMKPTSFSEILIEQYATIVCLIYLCLFNKKKKDLLAFLLSISD